MRTFKLPALNTGTVRYLHFFKYLHAILILLFKLPAFNTYQTYHCCTEVLLQKSYSVVAKQIWR